MLEVQFKPMIMLMFLYYIMGYVVHIFSTHYISHYLVVVDLNVPHATNIIFNRFAMACLLIMAIGSHAKKMHNQQIFLYNCTLETTTWTH
jgi:hypothetical protein